MEDDKLLAEYSGITIKIINGSFFWMHEMPGHKTLWIPDICWNQLMMVIEKIRKELNDKYSPCRYYDLHEIITMLANSFIGKHDYTIKDIRNACVDYIKQKK